VTGGGNGGSGAPGVGGGRNILARSSSLSGVKLPTEIQLPLCSSGELGWPDCHVCRSNAPSAPGE
jgi:hypothetical protein